MREKYFFESKNPKTQNKIGYVNLRYIVYHQSTQ